MIRDLLLAFAVVTTAFASLAHAQPAPGGGASTGLGPKLYREANCIGCHRWHGGGGGGYGGAALSLRASHLDRDQMLEIVRCGRPGSGMPYFERDAYAADGCYGVHGEALGKDVPAAALRFLRPPEIAAIVDYVRAGIVGRGEPDHADCVAFFGEGSRMCQVYEARRPEGADAAGTTR